MTRRELLTLLVVAACSHRRGATNIEPLGRSLLRVASDCGQASVADQELGANELERIAEAVRKVLTRHPELGAAHALNQVVFEDLGFVREVHETRLDFVLLPSVLRQRRGSCVGLGTLYLALGESIKVPVEGVVLPGHFFVRVRQARGLRNVELLRHGEEMPDSWYRERYPIPMGAGRAYARALTSDEVLGVVEYDVGNERRRQGRLAEARRAYEQATLHFADLGEAHASLGSVLHLLGALQAAEAAYQAARRVNPALAGLERNLELLQNEQRGLH